MPTLRLRVVCCSYCVGDSVAVNMTLGGIKGDTCMSGPEDR